MQHVLLEAQEAAEQCVIIVLEELSCCWPLTKVVTSCNNRIAQFKPIFQVEGNTFRPIFFGCFILLESFVSAGTDKLAISASNYQ